MVKALKELLHTSTLIFWFSVFHLTLSSALVVFQVLSPTSSGCLLTGAPHQELSGAGSAGWTIGVKSGFAPQLCLFTERPKDEHEIDDSQEEARR